MSRHTFNIHYAGMAVYLFFIISGFVIYFSLRKGIKDYVISRFLRLYPLFWVCCTITYVVTFLYGENLPIKRYFISMLLFNDGKMLTMVDGSYWTLTFELLFYFYIGVFVWLFGTKKLEWFYILWLAISFLSFYLKIDQHIVIKLLSVRFAPYFAFGGVLALMVDRYTISTYKTKLMHGGLLIISSLLPLYISAKLRAQQGMITNFTGSFDSGEMRVVLSFFVIVPVVVYLSRFSFAKTKKISSICFTLGGITYPLYLLHWKIGNLVISHSEYKYGSVNVMSVSFAVLLVVIAYYLSVYELSVRKYLKLKIDFWFR
jgi:peptidoglycan/LPS O-acetylase OafA/YrhL